MLGCKCLYWGRISDLNQSEPEPFSLPASIPQWPPGLGFGNGIIRVGELEVRQITELKYIWGCNARAKTGGASFFKPMGIPDGFHSLGHYCQSSEKPLWGFILVAREVTKSNAKSPVRNPDHKPALISPVDYTLVWCSNEPGEEDFHGCGYFWSPEPPEGYKALGFLVTDKPNKPELDDVRCVRADLTDECETDRVTLNTSSKVSGVPFRVWTTRPQHRGMHDRGVLVGTFFCSTNWSTREELDIACLKNSDPSLHAMPNLDQIHALIRHYGPTVFFHPEEIYLPSSVSWFFENGALLYRHGETTGERINSDGSNLPGGGTNDREYWIDLPIDSRKTSLKRGNIQSAKLYVHVKPAWGGTFTDIAMWVFCPFNGPATLKLGVMNIALGRTGQHVSDWEHFTLRVSNFTGELWSIYFSQHSGGQWVAISDLEFNEGNKAAVYSAKNCHASYPHPGNYIQGSSKVGIGIRNDAARSDFFVDSSTQYEIISAEYLGDGVVCEPCWLQYMREWGPIVVYGSRSELNRILSRLPSGLRYSAESVFNKLPLELSGEEGPTGPKEKNNWIGDERS